MLDCEKLYIFFYFRCCEKYKKYLIKLFIISVIICFYNEVLLVLLRMVYSVMNCLFVYFLVDIIFVDDFSEYGEYG